jgi:hypothetical protein
MVKSSVKSLLSEAVNGLTCRSEDPVRVIEQRESLGNEEGAVGNGSLSP